MDGTQINVNKRWIWHQYINLCHANKNTWKKYWLHEMDAGESKKCSPLFNKRKGWSWWFKHLHVLVLQCWFLLNYMHWWISLWSSSLLFYSFACCIFSSYSVNNFLCFQFNWKTDMVKDGTLVKLLKTGVG